MKKTIPGIFLMSLLLVKAIAQNNPAAEFVSSGKTFTLIGDLKGFKAAFSSRTEKPGLDFLTLTLKSDQKILPPSLKIKWSHPLLNVAGEWTTARGLGKNLNGHDILQSRACTQAPIVLLYGYDDNNKLSFACSDALNALGLTARVNESIAAADCEVQLFTEVYPATDQYSITIRIDTRDQPYWKSLQEISQWWERMPQYKPAPVPDAARWPMYSTW
jgi:alpha-galactosidase